MELDPRNVTWKTALALFVTATSAWPQGPSRTGCPEQTLVVRACIPADCPTDPTHYLSLPWNGHFVSIPIYARTPLGQSVGVGTYSDTVVITVEW